MATAVTLSAVSIIYDTSGTEVELAAANYTYSNGVITLNLTSGSGRVTLDNLSDGITISTTWSNGDVATDTSNVLAVRVPISITAPESFNYNSESVSITADNVTDGVTLSAVSIIYDTSGTEVELAAANYTYSNGVITLNLTSGSGRVTLNNLSDGVTISTTWSNGDVATDTSNVLEVLPISITAPASFIYNQNGVEVTAANIPTGVTLSGVSLVNGGTTTALNTDNYSISGNTITLNFGYEYGKDRVLLANTAASITISTTWSNGETATDTTTINTGVEITSMRTNIVTDEFVEIYLNNYIGLSRADVTIDNLTLDKTSSFEWLSDDGYLELQPSLFKGEFAIPADVTKVVTIVFTWSDNTVCYKIVNATGWS